MLCRTGPHKEAPASVRRQKREATARVLQFSWEGMGETGEAG